MRAGSKKNPIFFCAPWHTCNSVFYSLIRRCFHSAQAALLFLLTELAFFPKKPVTLINYFSVHPSPLTHPHPTPHFLSPPSPTPTPHFLSPISASPVLFPLLSPFFLFLHLPLYLYYCNTLANFHTYQFPRQVDKSSSIRSGQQRYKREKRVDTCFSNEKVLSSTLYSLFACKRHI